MKKFLALTGSKAVAILILLALSLVFHDSSAIDSPKKIQHVRPIQQESLASFPEPTQQDFANFTSGTGFFVSSQYIITNEHVVRECTHIRIRGAVQPAYANIKSVDKVNDLALLVTNRMATNTAPLRGNMPVTNGEKVTVMGYPMEHGVDGTYLVRKAQITNPKDISGGVERIQFTDSVAKGNSGGPLLDTNGTVIGVVVGKMSYYLADADEAHSEPVKTSSVAVGLDALKDFLSQNRVYYRTDDTLYNYADSWMENKAKQYIVNIHCVKSKG